MAYGNQGSGPSTARWIVAAVAGILAFLLAKSAWHHGFFWALLIGLIVFAIVLLLWSLFGGQGDSGHGASSSSSSSSYASGSSSASPTPAAPTPPAPAAAPAAAAARVSAALTCGASRVSGTQVVPAE